MSRLRNGKMKCVRCATGKVHRQEARVSLADLTGEAGRAPVYSNEEYGQEESACASGARNERLDKGPTSFASVVAAGSRLMRVWRVHRILMWGRKCEKGGIAVRWGKLYTEDRAAIKSEMGGMKQTRANGERSINFPGGRGSKVGRGEVGPGTKTEGKRRETHETRHTDGSFMTQQDIAGSTVSNLKVKTTREGEGADGAGKLGDEDW
ncbi:uncharacterized protein CIMG_10216 [Coccidioides immitis RS]|uniref:Uncharacterized protein n=1 Tax=Coccidioides immitis (strain RS) TaxID=246410 RepID=J3K118_COCIM|nr:uncharacterized protein CIMG_10216 [Coccidioides immitis RS]EAS27611.3 hypothetical protein CIMG_10216 [Coccidioides immitis RS]